MQVSVKLMFATALLGAGFAWPVIADEPEQVLGNPGFRPESELAAAFVRGVAAAEIAVLPAIIRTPGRTSHSSAAQQWVVEFLNLNMLGSGKALDIRFDLGQLQGMSQWEMFQSSMQAIGRQIREHAVQADYVLSVEVLIPPAGPRSSIQSVFGIHCFVMKPDGENAFSFLLNSHHKAFNDANLQTTDLTAKGREWLASEGAKLALFALKEQVDQHPEAASPASSDLVTSMVDDFESGLPSGTDSVGLQIGFHTFSDATSTASISVTTDHPALPGEVTGNGVLLLEFNVTGWGGFIHKFENEARDKWASRDWKSFLGLRFWVYGNNTGASLFVDVLDNRKRYSTSDDAERYTYQFRDDFAGWQQITVPFARMTRKEVGNAAPGDGLNLQQVHGWAFGISGSVGQISYFIDDLELYGGRVSLPGNEALPLASDSKWRNLQTKEGRFRVHLNVRMDPPEGAAATDFPKLAVFDWYYRPRFNGMPKDKEQLEQFLAWGRRLDEMLVSEKAGFQFANRGGAKRMSALFYVADVEKLKHLSQLAGEQEISRDMQIQIKEDPAWEEWRRLGRLPESTRRFADEDAGAAATPVSAMDPVLRFYGFSVRRPDDYRWRLLPQHRADIANFAFAPLSPTHSFNATIMLRGLPQDFPTRDDFKAFIDTKVPDSGPRFANLSYESSLTELHGQWAVEYQALFLDKGAANSATPLHMTIKGVVYMHPLRERRVIDAFYSERGTESELDGTLDPVGEALIHSTIPER